MKDVRGMKALCWGAIAANVALLGVLWYNTSFSNKFDTIAFAIASFGILVSMLYAVQLLLMRKNYFNHRPVTSGARLFLHIARIILLLYTLVEALLLGLSIYNSYKYLQYDRNRWDMMIVFALILVIVVLDITIFFKGWRLLKLVRNSYIDEVMASFDVVQTKQ